MPYYISKINIENIRCFTHLEIDLEDAKGVSLWTTLVGDNAAGKSTLLKCIAMGLCDQSSAAGLLRESDKGYIRKGSKKPGIIELTLRDAKQNAEKCVITTIIERVRTQKIYLENLRQKCKPSSANPWDKLFVAAYGVGRGVSATGDISSYYAISAVYNLFNYSEGLQNPELIMHRLRKDDKNDTRTNAIKHILRNVLNLSKDSEIHFTGEGIKVDGPWGPKMPLRDLADGHRSMFHWMVDFAGWSLAFNPKIKHSDSIRGIVLVDALDEHLHPKWQRTVVSTLRKVFPKVQFIATTHSPLLAGGTSDERDARLYQLELGNQNVSRIHKIDLTTIHGLRADQLLRSDAFNLLSTVSPGSDSNLVRYCQLSMEKTLTGGEQQELEELREITKKSYVFGNTYFESEVEEAVLKTLEKMIKHAPSEIHKLEAKRQLSEIFRSGDE